MSEKARDLLLVEAAERRARIIAVLRHHEDGLTTEEIATAISITVKQSYNLLYRMAESGLIRRAKRGSANVFFSKDSPDPPANVVSAPTIKPEKRRVDPPKEIELVIGGMLILIGRNPVSRKLRITIEDAG